MCAIDMYVSDLSIAFAMLVLVCYREQRSAAAALHGSIQALAQGWGHPGEHYITLHFLSLANAGTDQHSQQRVNTTAVSAL